MDKSKKTGPLGFAKPYVKKVLQSVGVRRGRRVGKPAIGAIGEVEEVYNEIFGTKEGYDILDKSNEPKLSYVRDYALTIDGTILDAGCGRGNILKYLLDQGVSMFGIELSRICCEKYLKELPVANSDIVSWSGEKHTYAGCICTDVVEHIPPNQLDNTLQALGSMSPSAFIGIANHSSIHNGHELHVIQEGIGWWVRKLGEYYSEITVIIPEKEDEALWEHFNDEVFFFLKCSSPRKLDS